MAGYALVIFILSSLSRPLPYFADIEKKHLDWLLHSVEYGVLGVLLMNAFEISFPRKSARSLFLLCLLFGFIYALSDEWHQSFVPNRDSNAADVAADMAGLGTAALIAASRIKNR